MTIGTGIALAALWGAIAYVYSRTKTGEGHGAVIVSAVIATGIIVL
jgi:hypothetical protein